MSVVPVPRCPIELPSISPRGAGARFCEDARDPVFTKDPAGIQKNVTYKSAQACTQAAGADQGWKVVMST